MSVIMLKETAAFETQDSKQRLSFSREAADDEVGLADLQEESETTRFLRDIPDVRQKGAVGKTAWRSECFVILGYAMPLIAISLLDQSRQVIAAVISGHLKSGDLAAVALASATAELTGYAVCRGLASALDTLCAQACGQGRKDLIGLYVQRMALCLLIVNILTALVWYWSESILTLLIPDAVLAATSASYLRVLILGAPGYAIFESGKRFTQSQGQYAAIASSLLVASAVNAILAYVLVWTFELGFLGLPLAISCSQIMLPVLLVVFTRLFHDVAHWPTPSKKVLQNWTPMLRLGVPGLVMLLVDFMTLETLTLAAAHLGVAYVAANMVLLSVAAFAYRVAMGIAIASGTRVAHHVGARSLDAVKVAMRVSYSLAACVAMLNGSIMILFRSGLIALFTIDPEVADLASKSFIIIAIFHAVDTAVAQNDKLLCGVGRQRFGAIVLSVCYLMIGIPASLGFCFGLHLGLDGLWSGFLLGLSAAAFLNIFYLAHINLRAVVAETGKRIDQEDMDTT